MAARQDMNKSIYNDYNNINNNNTNTSNSQQQQPLSARTQARLIRTTYADITAPENPEPIHLYRCRAKLKATGQIVEFDPIPFASGGQRLAFHGELYLPTSTTATTTTATTNLKNGSATVTTTTASNNVKTTPMPISTSINTSLTSTTPVVVKLDMVTETTSLSKTADEVECTLRRHAVVSSFIDKWHSLGVSKTLMMLEAHALTIIDVSKCQSHKLPEQTATLYKQLQLHKLLFKNNIGTCEDFISGHFTKFLNNDGSLNPTIHANFAPAFAHWTWVTSGKKVMVSDIQGIRFPRRYVLTDPAVHSSSFLHSNSNSTQHQPHPQHQHQHQHNPTSTSSSSSSVSNAPSNASSPAPTANVVRRRRRKRFNIVSTSGNILMGGNNHRNNHDNHNHCKHNQNDRVVRASGNIIHNQSNNYQYRRKNAFGVNDLGMLGIRAFFQKHVCNDLCKDLGLRGFSTLPMNMPMTALASPTLPLSNVNNNTNKNNKNNHNINDMNNNNKNRTTSEDENSFANEKTRNSINSVQSATDQRDLLRCKSTSEWISASVLDGFPPTRVNEEDAITFGRRRRRRGGTNANATINLIHVNTLKQVNNDSTQTKQKHAYTDNNDIEYSGSGRDTYREKRWRRGRGYGREGGQSQNNKTEKKRGKIKRRKGFIFGSSNNNSNNDIYNNDSEMISNLSHRKRRALWFFSKRASLRDVMQASSELDDDDDVVDDVDGNGVNNVENHYHHDDNLSTNDSRATLGLGRSGTLNVSTSGGAGSSGNNRRATGSRRQSWKFTASRMSRLNLGRTMNFNRQQPQARYSESANLGNDPIMAYEAIHQV